MRRGTGTFKVRKLKPREGGSDVTSRESTDELTRRAEEVNTLQALIEAQHIKPERWSPPLIDADSYAFCQALYKGIEGKDWEEMSDSYKKLSKALGLKKAAGEAGCTGPKASPSFSFWKRCQCSWGS